LLNINFLNEALNEKNIEEPNEIFNYVRNELINSISKDGQKDGFDGVLLCIDKLRKKVNYAAANSRPILVRDEKVINLSSDKMPVGKGERHEPFRLFELDYLPGDVVYLYSDGFADQFGGVKGKKFKYKQLEALLNKIHNEEFSKQQELIQQNFSDWKGQLEQVDDVCVIGLKL
jgi:serine phosphatase RsbU (regulator of sigma subunit)